MASASIGQAGPVALSVMRAANKGPLACCEWAGGAPRALGDARSVRACGARGAARGGLSAGGRGQVYRRRSPPPPPPILVLSGHAASLTPY